MKHLSRPAFHRGAVLAAIVSALAGAAAPPARADEAEISIVPLPARIERQEERFHLSKSAAVAAPETAAAVAGLCASQLRTATDFDVPLKSDGDIVLELDSSLAPLTTEGYTLAVTPKRVVIRSCSTKGLYYGFQSFRQLLPPEIFAQQAGESRAWTAPACVIEDKPRFPWRAMMLDSSRSFQSAEYIKKYIDWLSIHKINIFHWHLTDNEGWRFESKLYPEFTKKGAWGKAGSTLPLHGVRKSWFPADESDGGFYTQEQMREIVAYAKLRNVEILPEIDLPGHSRSAVIAYPEIACKGKDNSVDVHGIAVNVWCASREENYVMMEKLLGEVADIFPFEYIHIGGDEVNHGPWSNCQSCNDLANTFGLNSGAHLQGHLTRRLETICKKLNRKLVGWNEIMGSGISKDTCIMSWIATGPGYHAASVGHPVVMAPGPFTYFDMPHAHGERGHHWAGIVSMEQTYSFDPLANSSLTPAQLANIQGVEACLWTCYTRSHPAVQKKMGLTDLQLVCGPKNDTPSPVGQTDYMTYPRLCALAEVGWTPQQLRNLDAFNGRMATHYARLSNLGIWYRVPTPSAVLDKGVVTITPPYPGAAVRYTLDPKQKTADWQAWMPYTAPFACANPKTLRAVTVAFDGTRTSVEAKGASLPPAASWKPGTFSGGKAVFTLDSALVDKPGHWLAELVHGKGSSQLKVSGVTLRSGKTVLADDPHGSVISSSSRGDERFYRLQVKDIPAGQPIELEIAAVTEAGEDVAGQLKLTRSPYSEPVGTTLESRLKFDRRHPAAAAADWLRHTYASTAGKVKKGDQFLWRFAQPVAPCQIEIKTGKPNGTEDILVSGAVEWSTDGVTFQKLPVEFNCGNAKCTIPAPFTQLRVTAEADHTWDNLIIQDPQLTPATN